MFFDQRFWKKLSVFFILFVIYGPCTFASNVLITGANRGLGLALTKLYLKQGWNVYAT